MITDNQLYSLAIFLGSAAMLMIVLYHFLEVNSNDNDNDNEGNNTEGVARPVDTLQSEKTGLGAVKPLSSTVNSAAGAAAGGGFGDERR